MAINNQILLNIHNRLQLYPHSKLLIVSKNRSQDLIKTLLNQNYRLFGENRVKEAEEKFSQDILDLYANIELHLIGALQSKKVEKALSIFDCIQTIDRKKLIDEIVKVKSKNTIKTKKFLIQINIGQEPQKSGIEIDQVSDLINYANKNDISIDGLMCIPPNDNNAKFYFDRLRRIRDDLDPSMELSMGMSNDYLIALEAGSNIIRVGSLIFDE